MKTVVVYEAKDGSRWDHQVAAEARETLIDEIEATLDELGIKPKPEDMGFANGDGYLRHPRGSRAKLQIFLASKGACRDSQGPVGALLSRLWCMDEFDREWGQGYFSANPTKGVQR